ncbi:MAG TPA: hypothetical protein VLT79_00905 [Gemmatimonadales bacterium]|nr:hypothetical protein [Gemmatimonadales bacterium]
MTRRVRIGLTLAVLGVLAGVTPGVAYAQESQFGITGLGTPGRTESVRARSTGGAFAQFDSLSFLTEASLVNIGSLTATASINTSNRDLEYPAFNTWLRTTRFPSFTLAGPVAGVFLGGGFSNYLDRTYSVVTRDSMILRGTMQPYYDQITSDGGVSDVHLGAGFRLGRALSIGFGVHLLPGSTKESATRLFDDSATYSAVHQIAQVRYEGYGLQASALLNLGRALSISVYGRDDSHLNQYVGDTLTNTTELPKTVGAALMWRPSGKFRLAGSATLSTWSEAFSTASNTVNWSAGLEIGRTSPVRLGVRGGQLPFGPNGTTPTEWGASLGTGRQFAHGHGALDLGVERLERTGEGLTEQVWSVFFGLSVRP